MLINISISIGPGIILPPVPVCRIDIRDASLMDAPAETIATHYATVTGISENNPVVVSMEIPDELMGNRQLSVWGHLSLNNTNKIVAGDLITTRNYSISKSKLPETFSIRLDEVKK